MTKHIKHLKAFTLIELMAVVIILGIVTTITVTSINYNIRVAKQKLYVEQIYRLEEGVKNWALANTDLLPDGTGIAFFDVTRLKDEGIIDAKLVTDPRDDSELNGCMVIRYDDVYQQFTYTYEDKDCTLVEGAYLPIVSVVGGSNQFAEVNDTYEIPEVSSTDYAGASIETVGPIIKKSGSIVTKLDTAIIGDVYTLEYEATDELLGLTTTEIVTVTVNDTISPIIVMDDIIVPGSYTIAFEANVDFIVPGSQITDNSCGISGTDTNVNDCINTLTPVVSGSVLPRVPGSYNITYSAEDSSGNTKYVVLTVNVVDTTAPTAPDLALLQYKLVNSSGATYNSTWTNQNVWIGNITSTDLGSGVDFYSYSVGCTGVWINLLHDVNSFVIPNPDAPFTDFNGQVCLKATDFMPNSSATTTTANIKIDKTNPTCTVAGGSATWTSASRTVTGTCVDTGGSGCNGTNPSYAFTTEINILIGGPGTGGGTATIADLAGNTGTCAADQTVKVDKTAPTCAVAGGSATWTNTSRTITGTCSDGGSGCNGTNPSHLFNTEINTTTAGPGTVGGAITVTDNVGLTGTCAANQTVKIDQSAPTVAFTPNGTAVCAATQNVVANITDAFSGVAASPKYLWTTSATAPADGSFVSTFTNNTQITGTGLTGTNYLWILGYDNVGYAIKNKSGSFAFPGVSTVVFGTNGNTTYAKGHSSTVTATVDPCLGGTISSLKYLWTTSATAPADGSFVSTFTNGATVTGSGYTGDYYLWIYVQDSLGTIAKYSSGIFKFDNTAPTCSGVTLAGTVGVSSWYRSTVTGTVTGAADALSGVASSSSTSQAAAIASTTLTGTVTDNAGNTGTCASAAFGVDLTGPIYYLGKYAEATWYKSFSTSIGGTGDSGSGIQTFRYSWSSSTATPSGMTSACTGGNAVTVTSGDASIYTTAATGRPTTSGTWYLHMCSINRAGIGGTYRLTRLLDVTPPTSTVTLTVTSAPNCRGYVTLTARADTGGSGLHATFVQFNGGAWISTTVSPTIGMVGVQTVFTTIVRDNAGNTVTKTNTIC